LELKSEEKEEGEEEAEIRLLKYLVDIVILSEKDWSVGNETSPFNGAATSEPREWLQLSPPRHFALEKDLLI
jgi:hypothetical protein